MVCVVSSCTLYLCLCMNSLYPWGDSLYDEGYALYKCIFFKSWADFEERMKELREDVRVTCLPILYY